MIPFKGLTNNLGHLLTFQMTELGGGEGMNDSGVTANREELCLVTASISS